MYVRNFGTCKENDAAGWQLPIKNVFGRNFCQNLPMLRGILFASIEIMHRPRSDCPLHFDITDIWQIRKQK